MILTIGIEKIIEKMIAIIDYGMGNLKSLSNALNRLNIECFLLDKSMEEKKYTHIILPGVGSFPAAMLELKKRKLINYIIDKKNENTPILGICLGMQILANLGKENKTDTEGLNFIDGIIENILDLDPLNKCHVGWNNINFFSKSKIFDGIENGSNFYFDHSYYFKTRFKDNVLCETSYTKNFSSGVLKKNLIGFQFHPEKSHSNGLKILSNFYNNFNA